MTTSRRLLTNWSLFALTVLVLSAGLLAACDIPRRREPELPVPLRALIPPEWKLLSVKRGKLDIQSVSIDGDEEEEWLIFYHYDNPPGGTGPVGGIIYDAQFDTKDYDPDVIVPFPYQPSTFLVPYRLLPDWHPGKGQGYLAHGGVEWVEVRNDFGDELVVYGDGRSGTRLSIFWWKDVEVGYGVSHFAGSHRVQAVATESGRVDTVTTWERQNERSHLCKRIVYERKVDTHQFRPGHPAIVFCKGRPEEPTYPEAVVLAWLLKPEDRLLLKEARPSVKPKLNQLLPDKPDRVTSLIYHGEAERRGTGNAAESNEVVITTVAGKRGEETFGWHLTEVRPQFITDTARWRIDDVSLLP